MSTRTLVGLWLAVALILSAVVLLGAQTLPDQKAIVTFQRAADDYAFLHRRIERRQPPLEATADAALLGRAIESMAAALRVARPEAREGDLFTPAVHAVLRARIATALYSNGLIAADLYSAEPPFAIDHDQIRVNGTMPWRATGSMPGAVLDALPQLPPELQYRFVNGDLVLVDVHASLIVDVMRAPASHTR